MKKFFHHRIASFLGGLFLLSSLMPGFSDQLNKLPSLLNHYHHHVVEEQEDLSFIDFIELHYSDESNHKNAEDHHDLPLYELSAGAFHALVHDKHEIDLGNPHHLVVEHFTSHILHYSFQTSGGIFQPPRNV